MKDSTQLLDLLATVGSDDIDPTKAAGRQALYPEVRFSFQRPFFGLILAPSIFPLRHF
jgi:hypothetical protein